MFAVRRSSDTLSLLDGSFPPIHCPLVMRRRDCANMVKDNDLLSSGEAGTAPQYMALKPD